MRGQPAGRPPAARAGDPHRLPEQEPDGGGEPAEPGAAGAGGEGEFGHHDKFFFKYPNAMKVIGYNERFLSKC